MTEEFDNFVLETTKALPPGNVPGTDLDYVTFIRERILSKTNEELAKVHRPLCYSQLRSSHGNINDYVRKFRAL